MKAFALARRLLRSAMLRSRWRVAPIDFMKADDLHSQQSALVKFTEQVRPQIIGIRAGAYEVFLPELALPAACEQLDPDHIWNGV